MLYDLVIKVISIYINDYFKSIYLAAIINSYAYYRLCIISHKIIKFDLNNFIYFIRNYIAYSNFCYNKNTLH